MGKILVTGGLGYIGSHTSLLLLENNYEIIVLDSIVNSSEDTLKKIIHTAKLKKINIKEKIKFIKGDIRDSRLLESLFNKQNDDRIEAVIHFAGYKSVRESVQFPLKYWENNVFGSLKLFEAMEKGNCQTIVFSSSATIYGYVNKIGLKETDPINPINPYGKTKATIELLLDDLYKSSRNKWRVVNLRYFNPVGAHHLGILGEEPLGEPNNIFPLLLKAVNQNQNNFQVFGDDWPTPDGTCLRDYIHVEDLADGHLAALKKLFSLDSAYFNINLGRGKATSVLELINEFEKANKIKIPFSISDKREGDVPILVADINLANEILAWVPKRNLSDVCIDGFNWMKKNYKYFN